MGHYTTFSSLYRTFIQPRSSDPDTRRREYILNVLLSGLGLVSVISLLSSIVQLLYLDKISFIESFVMVPLVSAGLFSLLWLSRKGYSKYIALIMVSCFLLLATYGLLTWGILLPMNQLLYAFCIVLAGVLFRARAAIIAALVCSLLFAGIGFMQINGSLSPDLSWLATKPNLVDVLGGVLIFIIIGLVTWLANTEIDRSLARARASETSLAKERDLLEVKVAERTQDLEKEHLIRIMELQRFAELGKLSASILHDISNPLTVASLNIEQMGSKYEPTLVKQTEQSLRHIERYVESARKQLVANSSNVTFSVSKEIRQLFHILSHRAKQQRVTLKLDARGGLKLTGDPVKFSQLLANLIVNAIEAYDNVDTSKPRSVEVIVTRFRSGISVSVHDNGKGLTQSQISKIFAPFYTTKTDNERNIGLGLHLVKETVEKSFHGSITAKSSKQNGTTFTARLFNT